MTPSDPDAPPSAGVDIEEAKRLVREEEAQADEIARRTREEAKGLLQFIDEDLTKVEFVMPVFDDQLKALQYVRGTVETRRQAQDIRHR